MQGISALKCAKCGKPRNRTRRNTDLCYHCVQPTIRVPCRICGEPSYPYSNRCKTHLKTPCVKCGSNVAHLGHQHCDRCSRKLRPEKYKQWEMNRRLKLKRAVLSHLGGDKCACCGETIFDFLSVDHINNDGALHRRLLLEAGKSLGIYRAILKDPDARQRYQVLCMNCNFGKRITGVCPHVTPIERVYT